MQLQQVRHVPGLMPAPQPCCHLQDPLGSRAPTRPPPPRGPSGLFGLGLHCLPEGPQPGMPESSWATRSHRGTKSLCPG